MNVVQRIAKNTLSLIIGQFIVSCLSLILSISIARTLGDMIFGKYSFALTFTAFFGVFLDLGYNTLLIREIAKNKSQASKYVNNVFSSRIISSFIVLISIVILINLMNYPSDTKIAVYLFGIYICIISLSDVFKLTLRAFEKMEYESFITVIANMMTASLGLLVIFFGYGLKELAQIYVISGILNFLISYFVCNKRFVKISFELDVEFLKNTIKLALPISMLSLFGYLYKRIDIIMISMIVGDAAVGWYNAAYNLVLGIAPISQLFMSALFPLISSFSSSSTDSLKNVYEKSLKYLMILGIPLALGITLLSNEIILVLYGEQFIPSIVALQILAWDILLVFSYMCMSFTLISLNKQNITALLTGFAALLNILLNLVLIPLYSYIGAAIATIITEALLVILCSRLISKSLGKIYIQKILVKILISSSIMGFFVFYIKSYNIIIAIIFGTFIYVVLLYMTNTFSRDDLEILKQLLMKKLM